LVDLMLRFWSKRLVALLALAATFSASVATAQQAASPMVVTPTNGLVTIESDLQKADNGTGVVTATGNVRIIYPDQRVVATSRQAQYFSRQGRVVLSGDVDVIQEGGHSIQAERLVYLVERERIVAEPASGQQVVTVYRLNAPVVPMGPAPQPATGPMVPQP
jgi:lipopolysaccharide export system protein LptA